MYNVRSSASSLRTLCVSPWKLMLKHCAWSAGQWSARRAKQLRELRPRSLAEFTPAMLCAASACVNGAGMLHTALCTPSCVHPAPPSFVSVSLFHIPAFYWIWRVMRNFLAFLHPTRSSWLCSKELQSRSCCPASHLLSQCAEPRWWQALCGASWAWLLLRPSLSLRQIKVSYTHAANSSTCSQSTAVLEGDFLGKIRCQGETPLWSCHHLTQFYLMGNQSLYQSPRCLFMIFFCTCNWLSLHHLKTWVRWG